MKFPRINWLLLATALLAMPFVVKAASTVDGSAGVNMGNSVDGYIYNCLTFVLSPGAFWTDPGWSGLVVPVGQFTGFDVGGLPLPITSLIPLGTSSVTVFTPEGEPLFESKGHETQLGGKVTLLEPQGDISMGVYQ